MLDFFAIYYTPADGSYRGAEGGSSGGLSLLVWIAVPVIVFILMRLFFSGRQQGRSSIWVRIFRIVIYAMVSYIVWHLVRKYHS
jgi:hypothetical protein